MAEEQKLKITGEFDASKLNAAVNATAQNIKTKMTASANSIKSIGAEANNAASTGVRSLESAFERLNNQATIMRKNMHSAVIQLGSMAAGRIGGMLQSSKNPAVRMVGSALTGAAAGAQLGSVAGPIGAAAGSLLGAGTALVKAADELEEAARKQWENATKRGYAVRKKYNDMLNQEDEDKFTEKFEKYGDFSRQTVLTARQKEINALREKMSKTNEELGDNLLSPDSSKDAVKKKNELTELLAEQMQEYKKQLSNLEKLRDIDERIRKQSEQVLENKHKVAEEAKKRKYFANAYNVKETQKQEINKQLAETNTQINEKQSLINNLLGAASNFKLTDDLTKIGGGTGYFNQMTGISDKVTQIISILKSQLDALKLMRDTTKNTTTFA